MLLRTGPFPNPNKAPKSTFPSTVPVYCGGDAAGMPSFSPLLGWLVGPEVNIDGVSMSSCMDDSKGERAGERGVLLQKVNGLLPAVLSALSLGAVHLQPAVARFDSLRQIRSRGDGY